MASTVEIVDFAVGDVAPEFYVGPENHFVCVPDIPLSIMQKITRLRNLQKQLDESGGDLEPILEVFDQLLDERSAALFRDKIKDKTIGVRRIMKILPYVMEKYGLYPTQPSKPSSDGSSDGETGSSSTDGPLVNESTSAPLTAPPPSL